MKFDIQDVEHEITLIENLQGIQDDMDMELRQSRNRNSSNNFEYDFDYYLSKKDTISFVIGEHINKAKSMAQKLLKKEMEK